MEWARMLAYITGTVDRELLLRNEYLEKAGVVISLFAVGLIIAGFARAAW